MKPRPPTDADYELADRFFYPVLDLIEDDLERGTDSIKIATILRLLAAWVARQDPMTAHTTLTLLARDMQKAAEQTRS